jgi:hypothetical protein
MRTGVHFARKRDGAAARQAIKGGMRKFLLAIIAATVPALTALAEQPAFPRSENTAKPGKLLPVKGATSANSCAAFGAGFVKVEGTDTCAKIGGYVSSGASAYMGAR